MQNLKSKYEQQEMKVSDHLWEKLEQKLDEAPAKNTTRNIVWWRYAAAVALIGGLTTVFLTVNYPSGINENQLVSGKTKGHNPNQNMPEEQNLGKNAMVETVPEQNVTAINTTNQKYTKDVPAVVKNQVTTENKDILKPKQETLYKTETITTSPQVEEKWAQNETPKPKVKYVSSRDLLFGVEIDKAKAEKPKSAMGINISTSKNESDILNPKRIKILGITLYDKDSITNK